MRNLALIVLGTLVLSAGAEERIDFNDHIRPLLSDLCFTCHGFDANAREIMPPRDHILCNMHLLNRNTLA